MTRQAIVYIYSLDEITLVGYWCYCYKKLSNYYSLLKKSKRYTTNNNKNNNNNNNNNNKLIKIL